MARTYRRDSNGRFASGGGGGSGGKKAAAKRQPAKMSKAAVGRQAKAAFKSAKTTAMTLARKADMTGRTPAGFNAAANKLRRMVATRKTASLPKRGRPKGASGGKTSNAYQAKKSAAAQSARSKAFSSKAPTSKAKAAYKAATSKARQAKMLAGGRTTTRGLGKRTDAGAANIRKNVKAAQSAAARVRAMERNRGRSGRRR